MPPSEDSGRPAGREQESPAAGGDGRRSSPGGWSWLAKAALAIRVNGDVRDFAAPAADGATVSILTNKDPQALDGAAPLVGARAMAIASIPQAQNGRPYRRS